MALIQVDNWSSTELIGSGKTSKTCLKHDNPQPKSPNLLVHVIDGFVIEESNVPFKVDNWSSTELIGSGKTSKTCLKHDNPQPKSPNLLVHVIDGFVIEESNVPFKVDNWSSTELIGSGKTSKTCLKHDNPQPKSPNLLVHVIDGFVIEESNVPFKVDNWSSTELIGSGKTSKTCLKHDNPQPKSPNLLVHVIDGFVIEESNVPFKQIFEDDPPSDTLITDGQFTSTSSAVADTSTVSSTWETGGDESPLMPTNCKFCGKCLDNDRAFWGKRFCSPSCGKRYSLKCTLQYKRLQRKNRAVGIASRQENAKQNTSSFIRDRVEERPRLITRDLSPLQSELTAPHLQSPTYIQMADDIYEAEEERFDGIEAQMKYASVPVVTWSAEKVAQFVSSIPGCAPSASRFAEEEIDGLALMLLKEEHMVNVMGLKLGPALKIACQLRSIKQEHGVRSSTKYLASPVFDSSGSL